MRPTVQVFVWIGLCAALAGEGGQAQAPPGPRVEVAIHDDGLAPGETRPAERDSTGRLITRPGDIIRYTLMATNLGADPAYHVDLVDPIPAGTEYILDSAEGSGMAVSYSIDGGRSYQPPPVLYDFQRPDGGMERRPALSRMYTHVRWLVGQPIRPGARVVATLRVRVTAEDTIREKEGK